MVRGDSALVVDTSRELATHDPGPQDLVEFKELVSTLISRLDPSLRDIAHDKLLGMSDAEIAEKLDVSPRTIHRKLTRIRTSWQTELDRLNTP